MESAKGNPLALKSKKVKNKTQTGTTQLTWKQQ